MSENIFKEITISFERIIKSECVKINEIDNINGIYIFYENDKAIYVGRTNKNRMRQRIQEHSRKGSNRNSATFALKLAKEEKPESKIDTYDPIFLKAKERVSIMKIRILKEDSSFNQLFLEAYIALKLNIKYFESDTH